METVTVIKHFNIPDYVTPGIVPGSIIDINDPFGFKGVKYTFHHGIIQQSPFRLILQIMLYCSNSFWYSLPAY